VTKYVGTNLADLHAEPSFLSELLTQVTNGVPLEILDQRKDWCRVRQRDGYEGWTYAPYLTDEPPLKATHITLLTATMFARPEWPVPVARFPAGTALQVEEAGEDYSRIRPCAGQKTSDGWVLTSHLRDLRQLPFTSEAAREEVVSAARIFIGTYYLWGGCTDWGIDCSGLAQLAHRLAGYAIPRDARLQFPAGRVVEEPFEAGDLLFFAGDESAPTKITHVGISTGGWKMIHSSRRRNGVYEEDLQSLETMRNTFAGARTFLKD
jgi:cell wall-associated NlpC family hydrolase